MGWAAAEVDCVTLFFLPEQWTNSGWAHAALPSSLEPTRPISTKRASMTDITHDTTISLRETPEADSTGRCPVHLAPPEAQVGACPFRPESRVPSRSKADQFVRRLLFVRERDANVSARAAESAFQKSMLISATRCTLTYVIFPFVLPAMGILTSVGPLLGIVIGVLALVCDVFSIRRFFAADHRYRWHFTAIAACVIGLLLVLLVGDIADLLT